MACGVYGMNLFCNISQAHSAPFTNPFSALFFRFHRITPLRFPRNIPVSSEKVPFPSWSALTIRIWHCRNSLNLPVKPTGSNIRLFVISADHSTQAFTPEYQNAWGDVAIPIILYHPGDSTLRGVDSSGVIQQIDIMPGVLSYLHYNKPYLAFGEKFTGNQRLNFAVFSGNDYRWIENNYLLFFDGKQSKALFNYRTDRSFSNNLLEVKKDTALLMEKHLKAFIQQYNNRLLRNKLVAK